nr:HZV_115-like protein [Apis mellifera nudivirus]
MTTTMRKLLIEVLLLGCICVTAIHTYVVAHRWQYESDSVRELHIILWRIELALTVCLPLILTLGLRIFYRYVRNVDATICTALFCLAMLNLSREFRRDTFDAHTDAISLSCSLGVIGLLGIIFRIWIHQSCKHIINTANEIENGITANYTPNNRFYNILNHYMQRGGGGGGGDGRRGLGNGSSTNLLPKTIFIEGTACLGKTSLASTPPNQSFDFTEYVKREPLYREKHSLLYVQALYDAELYADMTLLRIINTAADVRYIDRSHMSQFCYAVIFAFNGAHCEPEEFIEHVDLAVFNRPAIIDALHRANLAWQRIEHLAGVTNIHTVWCVSAEPRRTAELMLKRGDSYEMTLLFGADRQRHAHTDIAKTVEERERLLNIAERYVRNQNYVFERVSGILKEPCIRVPTTSLSSYPIITTALIHAALNE